jgi:hypothetical protein
MTIAYPGGEAAVQCVSSKCQTCPPGLVLDQSLCVDPQLTRKHCGSAAAQCTNDKVCVGGACVPLSGYTVVAGVSPSVSWLIADANYVYYTDGMTLSRVPVAGGLPNVLATLTTGNGLRGVTLDSLYVYYTIPNYTDGGVALTNSLMRVAKAGGAPQVVYTDTTDSFLLGLILDTAQGMIYGLGSTAAELSSVPVGGGTPTVLWTASPPGMGWTQAVTALAQNSTAVVAVLTVWPPPSPNTLGFRDQYLVQVPKAGGSPTVTKVVTNAHSSPFFLPPIPGIDMFAVDETYYYRGAFSQWEGTLMGVPLSGTGSTLQVWFGAINQIPPPNPAAVLVLDGGDIFILEGGIRRLPKCNNRYAPLVLDVPATLLTASNGYVYWSDGGMIGRVAESGP